MADVVVRALRDTSLRVEERLKVACHVARSESLQGLLEDKATFLANWACEEICNAHSKRNK